LQTTDVAIWIGLLIGCTPVDGRSNLLQVDGWWFLGYGWIALLTVLSALMRRQGQMDSTRVNEVESVRNDGPTPGR
jgi:hypothetical protein